MCNKKRKRAREGTETEKGEYEQGHERGLRNKESETERKIKQMIWGNKVKAREGGEPPLERNISWYCGLLTQTA